RRPVNVEAFACGAQTAVAPTADDAHPAMSRSRPQIDQQAPGLQDAMRLAEGMDHARSSHSSERPAQHDDVERSGRVVEALGPPHPEAGTSSEALEPPAGGADSYRLGVDPTPDRPKPGEPQRQPTVAATDLENVPAAPLGDALERSHLPL